MNELISGISRFVAETKKCGGIYPTPLPTLSILHDTRPTKLEAMVYDRVICLVLQGVKETYVGDRRIRFGAGDSLIVSHSMPVLASVTEASREKPYIGMILGIDLGIVRGFYDEVSSAAMDSSPLPSLEAAPTDPLLIDCMARLFRASLDPVEAQILAPIYVREAHFRLLQAGHSGMLQQLLWRDSAASRIGRAITKIRSDFSSQIPMADLAEIASMSLSAFHQHFKALTSRSPLQFQKDLRLTEARRLLTVEGHTVSATAFAVGYESPTQFSREYSRKFGVPPRADIARQVAA